MGAASRSARRLRGHAFVVAAAFCWGVSAVIAKRLMVAEAPISVERLVLGRTVVAAVLLAAWTSLRRPLAMKEGLPHAGSFLLSGSILALVNFTYYSGVRDAGVAVGSGEPPQSFVNSTHSIRS